MNHLICVVLNSRNLEKREITDEKRCDTSSKGGNSFLFIFNCYHLPFYNRYTLSTGIPFLTVIPRAFLQYLFPILTLPLPSFPTLHSSPFLPFFYASPSLSSMSHLPFLSLYSPSCFIKSSSLTSISHLLTFFLHPRCLLLLLLLFDRKLEGY